MKGNLKVTTEPTLGKKFGFFLSREGSLNGYFNKARYVNKIKNKILLLVEIGKVNLGLWNQNIYYQSQSCVHGNLKKDKIAIQL